MDSIIEDAIDEAEEDGEVPAAEATSDTAGTTSDVKGSGR